MLAIVSSLRYISCMFKLPDYSGLDFPTIKFPDFKLPDFKLADLKFPAIDFPTIDLPGLDFSSLDVNALRDRLGSIDTTKVTESAAKLTGAVRDAAYLAIGLGVTSVEMVKARREQLTAIVTEGLDQARGLLRNSV